MKLPKMSPVARSLFTWCQFVTEHSRGAETPTVARMASMMNLTPGNVAHAADELARVGLLIRLGDELHLPTTGAAR